MRDLLRKGGDGDTELFLNDDDHNNNNKNDNNDNNNNNDSNSSNNYDNGNSILQLSEGSGRFANVRCSEGIW